MKYVTLVIFLTLLFWQILSFAKENLLIGNWKLVSILSEEISSGISTQDISFGKSPRGYLNYSSDGRMMVLLVADNRVKPINKTVTTVAAAALFRSMNSYAGTYTLKEDRVIHHVDLAWNPSWSGTDQIRFYKFEKDHLVLTMPATLDEKNNQMISYSLVWEKLK